MDIIKKLKKLQDKVADTIFDDDCEECERMFENYIVEDGNFIYGVLNVYNFFIMDKRNETDEFYLISHDEKIPEKIYKDLGWEFRIYPSKLYLSSSLIKKYKDLKFFTDPLMKEFRIIDINFIDEIYTDDIKIIKNEVGNIIELIEAIKTYSKQNFLDDITYIENGIKIYANMRNFKFNGMYYLIYKDKIIELNVEDINYNFHYIENLINRLYMYKEFVKYKTNMV